MLWGKGETNGVNGVGVRLMGLMGKGDNSFLG